MEKQQEQERQTQVERILQVTGVSAAAAAAAATDGCRRGMMTSPRVDVDQRARETIEKAKQRRESWQQKSKANQEVGGVVVI